MQEGPAVICHPFPVLKSPRGFINTPNTQMNSDFCAFVIKSASLYSKDAQENLPFPCNPIDSRSSSSQHQDCDGWRREHPRELY